MAARGLVGEWLTDGSVRVTTRPRPVFGRDPRGRRTFFNAVCAARAGWRDARNDPDDAVCFGDDGGSLDRDAKRLFDAAAEYMDKHAVRTPWQAGDVLLLDNRQVLHARDTFVPPRRVLASMWGAREDDD